MYIPSGILFSYLYGSLAFKICSDNEQFSGQICLCSAYWMLHLMHYPKII